MLLLSRQVSASLMGSMMSYKPVSHPRMGHCVWRQADRGRGRHRERRVAECEKAMPHGAAQRTEVTARAQRASHLAASTTRLHGSARPAQQSRGTLSPVYNGFRVVPPCTPMKKRCCHTGRDSL